MTLQTSYSTSQCPLLSSFPSPLSYTFPNSVLPRTTLISNLSPVFIDLNPVTPPCTVHYSNFSLLVRPVPYTPDTIPQSKTLHPSQVLVVYGNSPVRSSADFLQVTQPVIPPVTTKIFLEKSTPPPRPSVYHPSIFYLLTTCTTLSTHLLRTLLKPTLPVLSLSSSIFFPSDSFY